MELVGVTSNKLTVVVILNKHFCFFSLSLDASNSFFFPQWVCHLDLKLIEKQGEVTPHHAQCYILKDTVGTMIFEAQHLCYVALITRCVVEESSVVI